MPVQTADWSRQHRDDIAGGSVTAKPMIMILFMKSETDRFGTFEPIFKPHHGGSKQHKHFVKDPQQLSDVAEF